MTLTEGKTKNYKKDQSKAGPRPTSPPYPQPVYPECEKLASVSKQSDVVGEFLEWLQNKKECTICKYHDNEEPPFIDKVTGKASGMFHINSIANPEFCPTAYYPYHFSIEELLAEFFEIDLNKVEKERRQMLEEMRKINEK